MAWLPRITVASEGQNLAPILTALKQDDPFFSKMIRISHRPANSIVATAEDLNQKMYVLIEGKVNIVCSSEKRRRLVVARLGPGAIFGQGALTEPKDSHVYVEAEDRVTFWTVPSVQARTMLVQYPILTWGLLQTYGERLQQVEDNFEDIAYRKLPERLAALLLDLVDEETSTIEGYSHQALADYLGTYRETVSAVLRDFKRRNLISLGYRWIEINYIDGIQEIAGVWRC